MIRPKLARRVTAKPQRCFCALSQQALLVTNNMRQFAKVPGLQLDNWITS